MSELLPMARKVFLSNSRVPPSTDRVPAASATWVISFVVESDNPVVSCWRSVGWLLGWPALQSKHERSGYSELCGQGRINDLHRTYQAQVNVKVHKKWITCDKNE